MFQFFPAFGGKDRNDEVKASFRHIVRLRKSDFYIITISLVKFWDEGRPWFYEHTLVNRSTGQFI